MKLDCVFFILLVVKIKEIFSYYFFKKDLRNIKNEKL